MIVLLDTGPLGLVAHPHGDDETNACSEWIRSLVRRRGSVLVPEIADYELRRELIRNGSLRGLRRLDRVAASIGYLPSNTQVMRRAAELWAEARRGGRPTADPHALDGDVILAAQAQLLAEQEHDTVVVATTNLRHLEQFVTARLWQEIRI